MRSRAAALALLAALLSASLGGCGSGGGSLWPFGGDGAELARKPANSTEYRCDRGATLYVRTLDANAIWVIAPDREIRLDKKAEGRYGFGRIELGFGQELMEFTDPPVSYTNCKRL